MAGGVGSRLYPLSTPEMPKQFIDLLDCGKTLLQLTYQRFLAVDPNADFWVVTSADYGHFVREQVPSIDEDHILLEPVARNTAPCIAYACTKIASRYPDANVIVTPADAYVHDYTAFAGTLRSALSFVSENDALVCVGIDPDRPETGYGYINASPSAKPDEVTKVISFKEKPDLVTAESYLAAGGYYWNAGIFVWNAHTVLAELRKYAPQICGIMDKLTPYLYGPEEQSALSELFPQCDKISVDYALMEKSSKVHMVPGKWLWSDLGGFAALSKITGKDYSIFLK